jgi:hypothetical protein
MNDFERAALGEMRRLVFANFCNGVPTEDQMVVCRKSRLEIEQIIVFVAKKIQESRFRSMGSIGPVLARIRSEFAKPERAQDNEKLASLKSKASSLRITAGTPIEIDLLSDIRVNRIELLVALNNLGPIYLSSELVISRVHVQRIDSPQMVNEINRRAAV